MSTLQIILVAYLVTVVAWAIFVPIRMSSTKPNSKLEKIFFLITIPFAPICWIVGLVMLIAGKTKATRVAKEGERPRPLPKNLRGKLKKDVVLFNNRTMSIAEVNRITGKEYTLEQIYGKKYVASLTEEDRQQFDDGTSRLHIDDSVRKDDPNYPAIERFARARMSGRLEDVRDLFAPDVTLVAYERETLHGIDAVLAFWQDRYDSQAVRRVRFDFSIVPCMLNNGIAVQERPERFASMFITFIFEGGLIKHMSLAPQYFNADYIYYGSFKDAPFTDDYFSHYFTGELEPKANRLPCPFCGELSENLEWHSFDHDDYSHFKGYRGEVSVCPHCHCTVEIKPSEQYDRTEEEQAKKPKPIFSDPEDPFMPRLYYNGFEYGTPLEGTEYLDALDDIVKIEPDEFMKRYLDKEDAAPRTARKCAEEFHHIFFGIIKKEHRESFDAIIECYRRAYEDGIVEAGNNLAILYINHTDKQEVGENLLRDCAEKGSANAAANYFAVLWGTHQKYHEAADFALSCKTPSIPVYWNLAVMYLLGAMIENNPLPVGLSTHKEDAKRYLNLILDGTAPAFDDLCKRFEKARWLLPRVDCCNNFLLEAWSYIGECIPRLTREAKDKDTIVDNILCKYLTHISVPEGKRLGLSLASERHNDHGDISRFALLRDYDGIDVYSTDYEEILLSLEVEKSDLGAWEAYLFLKSRNLLPTYWHGGYNSQDMIFCPADLKAIPSQRGRATDVIMHGDDLVPHVRFEGDTATVSCCVWSEWGGLFRESVQFAFNGNKITAIDWPERKNLYMYDCGIMF